MRRRSLLLATPALILPHRRAGASPWQAIAVVPPPSAPSFTGPGDILSYSFWGGLYAYSGAVAATGTQKAVKVRRASDNTTQDIVILTTGLLDVAALTTFLTSTTGFVDTLYDQSGNGKDATQATTAKQPQIFASGGATSTLPYMSFNGTTQFLLTPALTVAAPQTFTFEALTNGQASPGEILAFESPLVLTRFENSTAISLYAGFLATLTGITTSAWHAGQVVNNTGGTPSVISVDGSSTTGTTGGTSISSQVGGIGQYPIGGTEHLNGALLSVGIASASASSGQRTSLNAISHGLGGGW